VSKSGKFDRIFEIVLASKLLTDNCSIEKDYYSYGMVEHLRSFSYENYKFGFNGKEKDDEVKGNGNWQNYGMRLYDPRLGKFLSVDPLFKNYPYNSVYDFAENDVIRCVDLDGKERYIQTVYVREDGTQLSSPLLELADAGDLGEGILTVIYNSKNEKTIYYQPEIVFDASAGTVQQPSASFSVDYLVAALPDPGTVGVKHDNIYEKTSNYLNSPSQTSQEAVGKFIGRYLYSVADDAAVYGSKLALGPRWATHLTGEGASRQDIITGGTNTLILLLPTAPAEGSLKLMNIAEFSEANKGSLFLKGSPQERGIKLLQENDTKRGLSQMKEDIEKSSHVIDFSKQLYDENLKNDD